MGAALEVTQIKGDGEAHPSLSPNDEFADFETVGQGQYQPHGCKQAEMLQYEYARSALQTRPQARGQAGSNPFKFGMIGWTDSTYLLATADDDNFFGKHSGSEPSPERMQHPSPSSSDRQIMSLETLASGYAAVWAKENTREAIFDAIERRETYATTGPGSSSASSAAGTSTSADADTRQPAVVGYQKGVPMGGDLSAAPAGKAPTFLVAALKDPIDANLDRIQIVKGWVDDKGQPQEKIYDVALSDDRTIGADGRAQRRSATPWTSRMRLGPTPSAIPS